MCLSEPSSCPPLQRKALLTTGTHWERNRPCIDRTHRVVDVDELYVCVCVGTRDVYVEILWHCEWLCPLPWRSVNIGLQLTATNNYFHYVFECLISMMSEPKGVYSEIKQALKRLKPQNLVINWLAELLWIFLLIDPLIKIIHMYVFDLKMWLKCSQGAPIFSSIPS